MRAYRIRVKDGYVQYVDASRGQVILTKDRDEAGVYSEHGATQVWKLLEGLNVGVLEPAN